MNKLLQLGGIAFVFIIALPFLVYFFVLSVAPKKTRKEKMLLAVFSTLIFSLFVYEGYEATGLTAPQALVVTFLTYAITALTFLEREVSPAVRIGILALGVVAFMITGS